MTLPSSVRRMDDGEYEPLNPQGWPVGRSCGDPYEPPVPSPAKILSNEGQAIAWL